MDVFKTLLISTPGSVGSSVAITGGSINGTNIGATTPGTGAFTTLTASGATTVTATTASTSTTTGALVLSGGVGVAGAGYFGGALNVAGTVSFTSNSAFHAISGTLDIGTSLAVAMEITGGASSATIKGYATTGGSTQPITTPSAWTFTNATASTSTTTGALVVSGGVGVAGAIYTGGVGVIAGDCPDTSIGKLRVGSSDGNGWIAQFSKTTNKGVIIGERAGVAAIGVVNANALSILPDGGTLTVGSSSSVSTFSGTTASTSTTTGALIVSGGVGVAGAANVGTYYGMVDGVTAPGATVGYAKIYVDTADGDLKVIFGDGTIKTLATDT